MTATDPLTGEVVDYLTGEDAQGRWEWSSDTYREFVKLVRAHDPHESPSSRAFAKWWAS